MAYVLKYTSNFYNIYKKYIEVEISKWNYTTPVIPLRNTEVCIEVNYQDNNTPIIGTGCSIVVVNQGEFADLEDLLTSTEKQFKCVIKYAGVTVFQGFSICDLNEQQFLPWSRIKLQFTDYLRRLEGHFATNFFISSNTDLLTMVKSLTIPVGFDASYELYVNSTLIETQMVSDGGLTMTFLPQTYVENNMFFSDPNTYDDVYTSVNKVLKPLGCFLYSCGSKWIIERHEDVTRDKNTSNWVKYSAALTASTVSSLKQELNKQNGDFQYIDESQILSYESGLQKLILNLKDKQVDTFIFNDYDIDMNSTDDLTPDPGTLALRTWYKYTDIEILQRGYDYRGLGSYIKWTYPPSLNVNGAFLFMGLYYAFEVQFPVSVEDPIILNVNYKMSGEQDIGPAYYVDLYYAIRVDGGAKNGLFLMNILLPSGGTAPAFLPGIISPEYPPPGTAYNTQRFDIIDVNNKEKVWSMSQSWNLTDPFIDTDGSVMPSLWDQLGNVPTQKFMIYFLPSKLTMFTETLIFNRINYLGDIEVTVTSQNIVNKNTYYINEDFTKTEEQDMEFWDLDNANFSNGFMYGLGPIGNDAIGKTKLWTSEKSPVADELMDIYAANKFRNYARTIRKLKSRIMYDGHIKPLAVITDDNRSATEFILQGYTWDLNNGVYDIVAEEYTSEEIIIDTEGGDGDPGVTPSVPTNLTAVQLVAGSSVDISWDVSTGASGYILQRQPYYNGITWISSWKTVWEGYNAFTADPIQYEAIPPNSMHFSYRVLAKTTLLYSAYSATEVLIWTA